MSDAGWAQPSNAISALEQQRGLSWAFVDGGGSVAGQMTWSHRVAWAGGLAEIRVDRVWLELVASVADMPAAWPVLEQLADRLRTIAEHVVVEHVRSELSCLCDPDRPAARLLVGASGPGLPVLLRALRGDATLRDRVAGVVSVGGWVLGHPERGDLVGESACRDWMTTWFKHEHLDVEPVRRVPYLSVAWMDRQGTAIIDGVPVAHMRFPEPGFVGSGAMLSPVEPPCPWVHDLGALDVDIDPAATALALRVVLVLASVVTA
jgi:hypothetical protein